MEKHIPVPARSWKMDEATKTWLYAGHSPEEQASLPRQVEDAEAKEKSSYFISVTSGWYKIEYGLIKGSGKGEGDSRTLFSGRMGFLSFVSKRSIIHLLSPRILSYLSLEYKIQDKMDMITKNERALLYLLSRTSHLTRMKLVKMMFLISKEQRLYDFVPYQYGPFSFQLYQDLRHLEREGHLTQVDDEVKYCDRIFPQPDSFIRTAIDSCIDRFGSCHEKDLIDYVYRVHPEMTIFSTIKRLEKYNRDETGIVTIGYEGRNIDRFLSLLIDNKVGKLIDVRKNPFSMKYGFSKNQLSGALEKLGISYLHFPDLGIDSSKRQNLTNAGYTSLFLHYAQELEEKQDHLARIISLSKIEKVALMCFEAQASDCHRGVIAQRFRDEGLCVTDL